MNAHIIVETTIVETPRVSQVRGMFDLSQEKSSRLEWQVELPLDEKPWHIGLIVGPSGCGKSTVARRLFGDQLQAQEQRQEWPTDQSILDAFPADLSIKEVTALLSSVGFSSPPAWLRPFRVLSTGEQFRVTLARLLAQTLPGAIAVMDEYTSVVDRTVAQIGSAALARTVRTRGQRFIAVTCHEDVEDWLQPDWTYRPATGTFTWRCLQRRPAIVLDISRCRLEAWQLFRHHHYLSSQLSPFAQAFLATWKGRPVGFSAWLPNMTRRGGRREHRTVILPDYQGVGIGLALSSFCAALWKALGHRATSTTTHPAFIAARLRSSQWRMIRAPSPLGLARKMLRWTKRRREVAFALLGALAALALFLLVPRPDPTSKATSTDFVQSLNLRFVRVPKGTFWMGGGDGKPGDHQVEIKEDFFLGATPVTQGQWRVVMNHNPSCFSREGGGEDAVKDIPDQDLDQFPVEQVSWNEIQRFLVRLNEKATGGEWWYRLPTGAEWEYACRGGATSKEECSFSFYLSKPINDLSSTEANFNGNFPGGKAAKGPYLQHTCKVGSYPPNCFGLYDMHGNVWQWCADPSDAEGPSRVFRGGSWNSQADHCSAATRFKVEPAKRDYILGFRLARVPSGDKDK